MSYSASYDSYAPLSSPESSPGTYPIDSSPCSSPNLDPFSLDDEDVPLHPLAGSYHSTNLKFKRGVVSAEPSFETPRSFKRPRIASVNYTEDPASAEDELWQGASEDALLRYKRIFEFNGNGLTRIDTKFLKELRMVVKLPEAENESPNQTETRLFKRVSSTPKDTARDIRRAFSKTDTIRAGALHGDEEKNIHLFLAANVIASIPRELFMLTNLVTLSLRNNKLRYLPPEIAHLKNLRDLNVAINQLKYLPCELNQLSLQMLQVSPNPFMEKPDTNSDFKPVTPSTYLFPDPVPSLVELTCRILVSPPPPSFTPEGQPPQETLLSLRDRENLYGLPPNLAYDLNACVPDCIPTAAPMSQGEDDEEKHVTGIGKCPNPSHGPEAQSFVRHAEERFSWEMRVGGLLIGGEVPLRWRGCCRGCLSFLDGQRVEMDKPRMEFEPLERPDAPLDFDDDE
ncbi:hypothetical protein BKA70DRAFT_1139760, partial [Coprinopsis sp. MPI-PUGE-AT-0042]